MAEHVGEQEPVIESVMEKITDKLHGDDSSSSDSDDDKKADKSSSMEAVKSKVYRIFGREKPLHKVLGGGKPIWLSLTTYFELLVSSQQSTQGSLLGTMLVTEGFQFIPLWNKSENHNFNGGGILWIFLEWTVAPLIACACAFSLFALLRTYLLRHENAEKRILILLPIYYGVAVGLLCLFVMYQVIPNLVTVSEWITMVATAVSTLIGALLSVIVVVPLARKRFSTARNLKNTKRKSAMKEQCLESQDQTCQVKNEEDEDEKFEEALNDFMKMRVLDTVYEVDERSWGSPETIVEAENVQSVSVSTTGQSTPFKELLQSTPNRLVQMRNFHKIEKSTARDKAAKFIQDSTKSSFFPVKIPLFFTIKFGGILIFTWKCHCTLSLA